MPWVYIIILICLQKIHFASFRGNVWKMAHGQETYEMNFSKTNKNYDVYSWHWLLFGLMYLNISSFIFDVL